MRHVGGVHEIEINQEGGTSVAEFFRWCESVYALISIRATQRVIFAPR